MNKMISLISAVVLTASVETQAAAVISEAYVNGLTVTTSGSAYFTFDGYADDFFAEAVANFGTASEVIDSASDFYPVFAAADAFPADFTTSSAAANSAYLDPFVGPSSVSTVLDAGSAEALTTNSMSFEVGGSGTVTLELDVTIITEITGALGGEYAQASVQFADSFGGYTDLLSISDGFSGDAFDMMSSTMTLVLDVSGLTYGSLFVDTYAFADTAIAPVPVPAAAWLFGSALLGLAGISRRKA